MKGLTRRSAYQDDLDNTRVTMRELFKMTIESSRENYLKGMDLSDLSFVKDKASGNHDAPRMGIEKKKRRD